MNSSKDSVGLLQSLTTASVGSSLSSSASGSSKVLSTTNWFTSEIQQMMYGFGDCRRPLLESAALVEEIVHQQMGSLLYQTADVAAIRGTRFVGLEEILYLLRKDKVKLRRLLRYLDLKDLKVAAVKGCGLDDEDAAEVDAKPQKKRRRVCYDFLASIDQTGELLALFDDPGVDMVKHERLVRAELMSRNMDTQVYKEFCEARQANFSRRYKSQRFKDWLMAGVNVDIKPNLQALEVMSYLAYETVAQIVDLALVVKQDQRAVQSQPEIRIMAPVRHNYHDLQSSSLFSNLPKSSLAGMGSPTEGFHSPPTAPNPGAAGTVVTTLPTNASTNTSNATQSASVSLTSQSSTSSLSLSRTNKKKRKRSGPATTLDISWNSTIMPADIREAMRRYSEDIGPFASVTKIRNPCIQRTRLLCT